LQSISDFRASFSPGHGSKSQNAQDQIVFLRSSCDMDNILVSTTVLLRMTFPLTIECSHKNGLLHHVELLLLISEKVQAGEVTPLLITLSENYRGNQKLLEGCFTTD
jgi:hypothetical protein